MSSERSFELTVRERELLSAQAEVARLTEQLQLARDRVREREATAGLTQSKSEQLLETLRSEFNQRRAELEEKCERLSGEVGELREVVARREGEAGERQREGERLHSLLQEATVVCPSHYYTSDSRAL